MSDGIVREVYWNRPTLKDRIINSLKFILNVAQFSVVMPLIPLIVLSQCLCTPLAWKWKRYKTPATQYRLVEIGAAPWYVEWSWSPVKPFHVWNRKRNSWERVQNVNHW